ncbi:MAG: tetratricopeptide repeat protein [Phycisphaerae bacterium]
MSTQAAHPVSSEEHVFIEDVWSRTEPKYRRRAFLLLTINVCLFAGLGCVAYWLRTGVVFAPRIEGYWEQLADTFNPTPDTEYTPTGLSLAPISIEQVPMMIPVLGLILAAVVSIPILVTILYRITSALPFIAVVGFIAVMPWLAITLLGSCLVVSLNPLRFRSRFASVLLALLPVILYFFMASRQSSSVVEPLSDPADRIKMLAPLILAIIVSAIVMGIVLIIARVVNYRPGAIAPLLAIMFLTPAAIFEFQVGRDELHYRLLEREFGPGSEYFVRTPIGDVFESAVERAFAARKSASIAYETMRDAVEFTWLLALDTETSLLFARYQDLAARAADRFIHLFPDSIYAINALYIKGRALDMRIDMESFRRNRELVFYGDFPSARSREAWEKLVHQAPESPMAADALLRLAMLDIREDGVDEAIGRLILLEETFVRAAPRPDQPIVETPMDTIMQREPPERSLDIPVAQKVLAGRRLRQLLKRNRDPLWGDEPLVAISYFDPRDWHYESNLAGLFKRYPGCQLADNIELQIALAGGDVAERIEALKRCVARDPRGDAYAEAMYQLGVAYQEDRNVSESRGVLERLVSEFPETIWREQAEARLRRLDRATAEGV